MLLLKILIITFILSFIFALGGLGSAVALIPILVFLGISFKVARATGLFVNFLATGALTIYNLKTGYLEFKDLIPMVIVSIIFAPIGAYVSNILNQRLIGIAFALFLLFVGIMIFIPRKKKKFKEEINSFLFSIVGGLGGFLSGLLGVGGGGIISPILYFSGYDPKIVARVTAFVVPFSSFIAFVVYARICRLDYTLLAVVSITAITAGYLAGHIAARKLNRDHIKIVIGIIFLILGIKFLTKFL